MIKSIKIGDKTIKNNLFIAPLAGFTDYAFREICLSLGAGLTYTEMISAKALMQNSQKTEKMLIRANRDNTAVQIFGDDADIMRRACKSESLANFDIIDINMGCPAPKIFNNGEGSALLLDIKKAEKIITECSKSGKIITVKTRIGVEEGKPLILDFASMCADCGAKLITIHARSREMVYSGEPNYELVKKVKEKVNIPVIVNGGIFSKQDFENAINQTGADGGMLARGVLENPTIICDILGKKSPTVKELLFKQLDLLSLEYEDREIAVFMRKAIAFYLKRVRNSKQAKIDVFKATSVKEIKSILASVDF